MDLKILDMKGLEEARNYSMRRMMEIQLEAKSAENTAKMEILKKALADAQAEIDLRVEKLKEKGNESLEVKPTFVAGKPDLTRDKIKNISHTLHNQVPIFSSGQDVHVWLNKLDVYYNLYVAKSQHKEIMEQHFLETAKGQICVEYLNNMNASGVETDTYEKLKTYMKHHHASKISIYQILDKFWEMELSESETLRDLGIRLDDKATEAFNIITAKFKEWTKADSSETEREMEIKDIVKVISGQVFLQVLKSKKPNIYNFICNDLDKTWSAADIANKAMTFNDRLSSEESQNQATVPSAFPAKKDFKNSNSTRRQEPKEQCHWFLKGHCNRGDKCDKIHDEALRSRIKEEPKSKYGNKKSKNAKKSNNDSVEQRTVAAAKIPLPTQDFRN